MVGIAVTRLARLGPQESAVLGTAGAFSAISALFGGPVIAGVLMMEGAIGFGASTMQILLPGFVAAAVGYLVFIGLGEWGGLHAQALTVPGLPPYTGEHLGDLSLAIAIGVISALLIVAVRRFAKPLAAVHVGSDFATKGDRSDRLCLPADGALQRGPHADVVRTLIDGHHPRLAHIDTPEARKKRRQRTETGTLRCFGRGERRQEGAR
jgi:hypothetical protein